MKKRIAAALAVAATAAISVAAQATRPRRRP